jgi:ABC-2 type transport system ATP-binding protein
MNGAITVAGLRKRFGRTQALDGLDLSVGTGEVHGFLGPNGAGKSTTIRVLLGLIRADGGTARLLGGDPWKDAVPLHRRLAYVPGDVTLWRNLSGGEIIDLYAKLRGRQDRTRSRDLLERFALDPAKKGGAYSKGNRQKVALVAAFASEAELLILDEPTSGLDPLMEEVFRDCVREARDRGATVLLSSHILSEVEALCDRVSIVRAGRTVETGALSELRHLTRTTITAEVTRVPEDLDALHGVHDLEVESSRITLQVDNDRLDAFVQALAGSGVRSLSSRAPTLEELFLRHYETEDRDAAVDSSTGPDAAASGGASGPAGLGRSPAVPDEAALDPKAPR